MLRAWEVIIQRREIGVEETLDFVQSDDAWNISMALDDGLQQSRLGCTCCQ